MVPRSLKWQFGGCKSVNGPGDTADLLLSRQVAWIEAVHSLPPSTQQHFSFNHLLGVEKSLAQALSSGYEPDFERRVYPLLAHRSSPSGHEGLWTESAMEWWLLPFLIRWFLCIPFLVNRNPNFAFNLFHHYCYVEVPVYKLIMPTFPTFAWLSEKPAFPLSLYDSLVFWFSPSPSLTFIFIVEGLSSFASIRD